MVRVPRRIREPLERLLDDTQRDLHLKIVEHRSAARDAYRMGQYDLADDHMRTVSRLQLGLHTLKVSRQQSTPPAALAAESVAP